MTTYTVSPEVAAAIEECKKLYPHAILLIDGQPASIVGMLLPQAEAHIPQIVDPNVSELIGSYQQQIQALLSEVDYLKRERDEANTYIANQAAMIRQQTALIAALRKDVKYARDQRDLAENSLSEARANIKLGNSLMESLDKKMHAAWRATTPVKRIEDVVR